MIRSFSLSDLGRILEIESQSFPKSPYDWLTFINLHYLYPHTFLVFIEEEGGRILGYIVFSPEGHVISIAVDPLSRGKGIGRELLEKVMNHLGIRRVRAEVRRSNKGAQDFYLIMGFQVTGVVPNYYGNEDALVMEWVSF